MRRKRVVFVRTNLIVQYVVCSGSLYSLLLSIVYSAAVERAWLAGGLLGWQEGADS